MLTHLPHQPVRPSLNHISLYVRDIVASANFYRDIIGLNAIPDPFKDGTRVWFSVGNNIQLHLISGSVIAPQVQRQTHACFSVTSVDMFAASLANKGIEYENARNEKSAITIRPDGFKQLYFQDPDGYWIEISDVK